ncbi:hypothetical protein [Cecembia lonarensis]|uniref:SnoaL-like domain-containing protein n=1 Tax=Cecembia lonarensis (strain CCUG 58316 / KCTC 22772 / LW9) TaxID=1225176 RepID=K1KUN1_CECL9|nr:hypothetical protein [Cecembia lonarensis]EKB47875.1 hypothetical protein B879_03521 [Cecembia lonarensis LW9]
MANKLLLSVICFFSFFSISKAQIESSIVDAAHAYARAQINADVESILNFTHPGLIEQAGGRENMKKTLQLIHQNQQNKGIKLQDFRVKESIQHTRSNGEIHALVPVVTTSKVPGGQLISETNLIAVSESGADRWYFIETTSIDERNVGKVLENWDGTLILPFKKAPVFKEDKK